MKLEFLIEIKRNYQITQDKENKHEKNHPANH